MAEAGDDQREMERRVSDSATPPVHDGVEPITFKFWTKTMEAIRNHPSSDVMTVQLAEMVQVLIQLGKYDPHIGRYLNERALQAMETTDGLG